MKALNEDDLVYSRVISDDLVEIIMDFKTDSYVGIGWRPLEIKDECKLFPDVGMKNSGFSEFFSYFAYDYEKVDVNS